MKGAISSRLPALLEVLYLGSDEDVSDQHSPVVHMYHSLKW